MMGRIIRTTPPALKRRILAAVHAVETETINIELSRGRILAETLRAPHPVPEMNRTVMDGYAVRHTDLRDASPKHQVCLRSTENIGAGHAIQNAVPRGSAVRIMTGAPMPPGTDSIVPVEHVRVEGEKVYFERPVERFSDVRRTGSEIRRGQVVLRKGQAIGPAQMAMLAFIDRARVEVHQRPRVAILTTGDELGPVGEARPFGHIPDSNRYGLIGQVESAGCVPVDGGRVGDTPEALLSALKKVTSRADFILTTGGVSAGDFDVVKLLFWKLGGVDLYRLAMKPGKPQAFGQIDGVPFFGLPGNPVSAMVVFDFLVRPGLRKLAGATDIELQGWRATIAEDFRKKTRSWEFPRAIAEEKDGRWRVRPAGSQKSSNLKSMSDADGYLVLSPDAGIPKKGKEVLFVPFPQ